MLQWTSPGDPGGYYESVKPKDSSFDQSKGEKKHATMVIEHNKFLGVEESRRTLILQVVKREESTGYGGKTPFKIIEHL